MNNNKNTNFERGFVDHKTCNDCKDCTNQQYDNINISCAKLYVYDWLSELDKLQEHSNYVEVRFKNTRKEIFENVNNLKLKVGDIVAVEAISGHDIGIVSAVGLLAMHQIKKHKIKKLTDIKKIYRFAKQNDIDKWKDAIALEMQYLYKTREFAEELKLDMKLSDVEFQGDKTKAIFYYIAEDRVDFRKLIKKMAETFKIKIEMKQIGARQEAGRVGGIGACGRELCCTTWLSEFSSVSTNAARVQELSLNPQKLTGQCSKLKCCLNNELTVYLDAKKTFPKEFSKLKIDIGEAYHIKNDVFKQMMHFEIKINDVTVVRTLPIEKVNEVLELNKQGIIAQNVFEVEKSNGTSNVITYDNSLNNDSIFRFAANKKTKKRKKRNRNKTNSQNQDQDNDQNNNQNSDSDV